MDQGNSDQLRFDKELYTTLKAAEMRHTWLVRQIEFVDQHIESAKRARTEVATGYQWPDDNSRGQYNGLIRKRKALKAKLEALVMSVPV